MTADRPGPFGDSVFREISCIECDGTGEQLYWPGGDPTRGRMCECFRCRGSGIVTVEIEEVYGSGGVEGHVSPGQRATGKGRTEPARRSHKAIEGEGATTIRSRYQARPASTSSEKEIEHV